MEIVLERLTLAEKLQLMERLWEDLSRAPESLPSPDWHREVLRERKRLAEEGKLKFVPLEAAFRELREELRGNAPT